MAFQQNLKLRSAPVAADLSESCFRFVVLDGTQSLAVAGAGVRVAGVLQTGPDTVGRAGGFAVSGISMIVAGAAIPTNTHVMSDDQGRAVPYEAGPGVFSPGKTVGRPALAAGEIISVMLELG